MRHACPNCRRSFGEPGFCPYDGTPLVIDKKTLLSDSLPAQRIPKGETEPERRGTFPLTPTPAVNVSLHEITEGNTLEAPTPKVRVMSASSSVSEVMHALDAPRISEYDRLVGETLDGRYFVEAKIGEGGMGVVFSARHAVIERPLAIKVLKRDVMRDEGTIRRFVQEAKAASRIGHPNIVDVTDFGTTPDGMTYSVMEFVVGQTLAAAIKHGAPFTPERTIRIASQIARALGAAHDKGIVHRDLKPENVFLTDRDGRADFVKIVDFGIAKVTPMQGAAAGPRLTKVGSVFGTPEYMAPEQAAGRSDTDGRVDIYALGVLMYEMICARVPHRADSAVRTLAMQMLDPIQPPSQVRPDLQVPPDLEAVIMNALAKRREARFQTMGALLEALERVLTLVGQSITGSPIYSLQPLPPGADPNLVAALPPPKLPTTPPTTRSVSPSNAPPTRSKSPTNRKHEPEFTAGERPVDFDHVFTSGGSPTLRRRWPTVLFSGLVVAAASGGIAVVMSARDRESPVIAEQPTDAAIARMDDAVVMTALADAGVWDAAVVQVVPADAAVRVRVPGRNGSGAKHVPEPPARPWTVQVLTKPENATLYVGHTYRGPGGVALTEPLGTALDVQCKLTGYKPGTVHVVFDGTTETVLCSLTRIKVCINGIKNPFDECEEAPAPAPAPAP
ncbi:MAG: serine/threonine protein kinase [Kofleriaceae bacterium]